MRRALESQGYTVVEANGYDEAVQMFEDHVEDFDLMVADVSLPYKNGIELARALLRKKPSLKVLFTSGYVGGSILRSSGLPQLERFFLSKPFHNSDFIAAVERILQSPETPMFPNGDGDGDSTSSTASD